MLKKLFVFIFLFLLFLILPPSSLAQEQFKTDISVAYSVGVSGVTNVNYTIKLQNLFTDIYATSYTLTLDNIKPFNVKAYQGQTSLPVISSQDSTKTSLVISFPDALVGKDKVRTFNLSYDDPSIAVRTGEVWEITIPRLSSDSTFSSYNLSLFIPQSLGQEAYLSPKPVKKQILNGNYIYYFDKDTVSKTGISAGFGEFQVFTFNLIYHLENPLVKTASTEIAIPPDTSLQKVYFDSLNPTPSNVRVDEDGNWLATYVLSPRQRLDVTAKGSVQIFSGPRLFDTPSAEELADVLKPTDYWQVNDPQIISLAKQYKTPKEIYDFVSSYLTYNFDRATPNVIRLGAVEALKEPKNAICMEFTDLFIAIARAAGIPAREINGFAYTENPQIQPLSLVSDVLHAWPEYWDSSRRTWVSIDPTWGATTGGVDYFNKLDLRHFAFVIHGKDSTKPYPPGSYKLGPNPQKDVFVNFGQLTSDRTPKLQILSQTAKFIPFTSQKVSVVIKNTGSSAFYNLYPQVSFDGKLVDTQTISVLPPFSNYAFSVSIPFSFLGTKTPDNILISAGDEKITVQGAKKEVIIYNLASIFIITVFLLLGVLVKLGKIKIEKISILNKIISKIKKHDTPQNKFTI